jgi:serine/threonine protein kinase
VATPAQERRRAYLGPGTKLGPYEITSPLGAGGMGEVYRARDTRLGRTVAIKVLSQRLSQIPDLQRRLNHARYQVNEISRDSLLQ